MKTPGKKILPIRLQLTVLFFLLAFAAAADNTRGIYIIYDSSNSMWGILPDGTRKYEAARQAMSKILEQEFQGSDIAFRMYGHRAKSDCADTQLIVPFGAPEDARDKVLDAVNSAQPTGKTPIDLSLRRALEDFGDRSGSIILVSDGIESCGTDPCALVRQWKEKNIDISIHVVGLGIKGKEREAMQCIANAAGTSYRDAFAAEELAESLASVVSIAVDTGDNTETDSSVRELTADQKPVFGLVVITPDDVRQRGAGVLASVSGEHVFEVETFKRFQVPAGTYQLQAGVEIIGGAVYKPVQQTVTVADSGMTYAEILAVRPPQVSATFSMDGEEIRSTVVTVFQDGQKLGSFKGDETAFVPEGLLEFRAKPAGSSQALSTSHTFKEGDTVTVSFMAKKEVHLTVHAVATATGDLIKSKPAVNLMRNGEIVDKINRNSGGLVSPGDYTVVIDDGLNRFTRQITVNQDNRQTIELSIPTGSVSVLYQDASGRTEQAKRIFIKRLSDGKRNVRRSNQKVPLVPGKYIIDGHPKAAGYPSTAIEIEAGASLDIVLKAAN